MQPSFRQKQKSDHDNKTRDLHDWTRSICIALAAVVLLTQMIVVGIYISKIADNTAKTSSDTAMAAVETQLALMDDGVRAAAVEGFTNGALAQIAQPTPPPCSTGRGCLFGKCVCNYYAPDQVCHIPGGPDGAGAPQCKFLDQACGLLARVCP